MWSLKNQNKKWFKDLNVRPKIKTTPEAQATKAKISRCSLL